MTSSSAEKFADIARKDAALMEKLGLEKVYADAAAAEFSMNKFIATAIDEAKQRGLTITETEVREWMTAHDSSTDETGELADAQLEAVAGGKLTKQEYQAPFVYIKNESIKEGRDLGSMLSGKRKVRWF